MKTAQEPSKSADEVATEVRSLIPASKLEQRVGELARQISADYAHRPLLVVGVLHGAYVFMADLVRRMTIPIRCGFVMTSSYGEGTVTSESVKLHLDLTQPVTGEDLLLVEDIVDTGVSISWLMDHLASKGPASIRLCALLDKPARRRIPVRIDYVGFEIPDRFVVGYGIDCGGRHRQLPFIGYVPTRDQSR